MLRTNRVVSSSLVVRAALSGMKLVWRMRLGGTTVPATCDPCAVPRLACVAPAPRGPLQTRHHRCGVLPLTVFAAAARSPERPAILRPSPDHRIHRRPGKGLRSDRAAGAEGFGWFPARCHLDHTVGSGDAD